MQSDMRASDGDLAVLGITGTEERVYRHLVGSSGSTVAEIELALALGRRSLVRMLDHLEVIGLVRQSPESPRRYHAAPPDMAVEALILKRQEELQRVRVVARELQDFAMAARQSGAPERMVELIASRDGERLVFEQMYLGATTELVTLMRLPMRVSRMQPPYDLSQQIQARERGVRFRTIIDGGFLDASGAVGYLRAEMAAGVEAREVPHLPFKLVMADRRVAIIPLKLEQSDSHILVVRSSALLDALYALFEILWERGATVSSVDEGAASVQLQQAGLDEDHHQVMSLLALGMNDKAIAHELQISLRTLERRIADILKRLGARTRFQAGFLMQQFLAGMNRQ